MTVDENLARGWYTDRRGRAWDYFDTRVDYDRWQRWESRGDEDLILEPDEMRLLIERDLHRNTCPGLAWCAEHPVPHVLVDRDGSDEFKVIEPNGIFARWFMGTLSEAMNAACALAVES